MSVLNDDEVVVTLFSEWINKKEDDLTYDEVNLLRRVEGIFFDISTPNSIWCRIDSDYMSWEKCDSYIGGNNDILEKIQKLLKGKIDDDTMKEISKMYLCPLKDNQH